MPEDYEDGFAYHANAIALGARFSAPGAWEAIGSVVLPSIGGRATASASSYGLDGGFVRVRAAASEVVGDQLPGELGTVYRTRATTLIEGFRIGDYLEIEHLEVQLESRYELVQGAAPEEPRFRDLRVLPGPMRVCGQPWTPQTTQELGWINGKPTFAEARQAFVNGRIHGPQTTGVPTQRVYSAGAPGQLALVTEQGARDPNDLWVFAIDVPQGLAAANVTCPAAGCAQQGATPRNILAGFGLSWNQHSHPTAPDISVRFGEYVVSHGRRRFTAVRVTLTRSPPSELVLGELALNGAKYP